MRWAAYGHEQFQGGPEIEVVVGLLHEVGGVEQGATLAPPLHIGRPPNRVCGVQETPECRIYLLGLHKLFSQSRHLSKTANA